MSDEIKHEIGVENETVPDEDPGSPAPSDLSGEEASDLALARTLINYGAIEPDTTEPPDEVSSETVEGFFRTETFRDFAGRTMPLEISLVRVFLQACRDAGVTYGRRAGFKVPFHGAKPGRDFKHVDCSGFRSPARLGSRTRFYTQ
jgi:hypothetical protein